MNILIVSKDSTLFKTNSVTLGDTRKRHIAYARELRKRSPGSSIRIIAYTPSSKGCRVEEVEDGLTLFPTNSVNRLLYLFDVICIFLKIIKSWKPDLITVQTPYEEGFVGLFLSRLVKAKYIPQIHFDIFSDYWRKEHFLNGWRRAITFWVLKHSNGVRVVSNSLRQDMIDRLGIDGNKIYVIPVGVNFKAENNDIDKDIYKRTIDTSLSRKPIVLFVGRFYAPKNLVFWVNVAERIKESISNACFVMVGDGVDFETIKTTVLSKNLTDCFNFLGTMNHSELPKIYAAADVFLLTSYYEGFGRVVLESYLAGVPVVSTRTAGTNELIDNGVTGFLHEIDDLDGVADSTVKLLSDSKLNLSMGQKGREKIQGEYSLETLVDKLISCWLQL